MTKVKAVSNTNEIKAMTKEELVACVIEYEDLLLHLEAKISTVKVKATGRKEEVLNILQQGHISVSAIAKRIGITARNVSSQLTYLRKDGYAIATDSLGRKFIEDQQEEAPKTILRKAANQ